MRAGIVIFAALLSLEWIVPAWAGPRILPVPTDQALDAPIIDAPRQKPVMPPVLPRGQMLYENHCTSCHVSVVHVRGKHRAHSLGALRGRVLHWSAYLHLRWGREEIEEVVNHLNDHYYRLESR